MNLSDRSAPREPSDGPYAVERDQGVAAVGATGGGVLGCVHLGQRDFTRNILSRRFPCSFMSTVLLRLSELETPIRETEAHLGREGLGRPRVIPLGVWIEGVDAPKVRLGPRWSVGAHPLSSR